MEATVADIAGPAPQPAAVARPCQPPAAVARRWRPLAAAGGLARRLAALAGLAAGVLLVGCSERQPLPHYTLLSGRVVARHVDTGELVVKGARPKDPPGTQKTFNCLVTPGSEIYINDKLCSLEDIQLGDEVELIGWKDRESQPPRFVISVVYLDHALPPPPRPELAAGPASRAASQPGDD